MEDGLRPIAWDAPWFDAWRGAGQVVASLRLQGACLDEALNQANAGAGNRAPVRFVPQASLPPGAAYESFIFAHRACPVRDNLHDFFNGLCWLRFPQAKARMNALQAEQIARDGVGAVRGPVRDALTLFDENGAVLCAPPLLWDAFSQRDWRRAFVALRPLWQQAHLTIVGHALLEKLLTPRKDLTAHVWAVQAPAGAGDALDHWLAAQLEPGRLAAKPFLALPIMGVPGWMPENAANSFYDDARVFRPAGRQDDRPPRGPRTTQPSATSRP